MSNEGGSFVDLVKEKGFDPKEAIEYGKKTLNDSTLTDNMYYAKYLTDKGVRINVNSNGKVTEWRPAKELQQVTVDKLALDEQVSVEVLVGVKLGDIPVRLCDKWHKVEEGLFCEKCGKEVEPQDITLAKYLVGDSTGEIPLILSPWLHKTEDLTGKKIIVNGRKNQTGAFSVTSIKGRNNTFTPTKTKTEATTKTETIQPPKPKEEKKSKPVEDFLPNDDSVEKNPANRILLFMKVRKKVNTNTLNTFYRDFVSHETDLPFDKVFEKAKSTGLLNVNETEATIEFTGK